LVVAVVVLLMQLLLDYLVVLGAVVDMVLVLVLEVVELLDKAMLVVMVHQ
jgi:hypothetical protein